eukprot:3543590-Amphidinium_carterae.1
MAFKGQFLTFSDYICTPLRTFEIWGFGGLSQAGGFAKLGIVFHLSPCKNGFPDNSKRASTMQPSTVQASPQLLSTGVWVFAAKYLELR